MIAWLCKGMETPQVVCLKNLDSLLKAAREKKNKNRKNSSGMRKWTITVVAAAGSMPCRLRKLNFWMDNCGAFVLFVIYKLFVTESSLKRKSGNKTADEGTWKKKVITPETDMNRLIREAVQQSTYRLAVRYHYLQSLHLLAEKAMCSWRQTKRITVMCVR